MTCDKCGADVITLYAGSTPVLRHAVAPKDAHYPRIPAARVGSDPSSSTAANPGRSDSVLAHPLSPTDESPAVH